MAIESYTDLLSEIDDWSERSYSEAKKQTFIAMVENMANKRLGQHYRRITSGTVTVDNTGTGALPTDFVAFRAFTSDEDGALPIEPTSAAAFIAKNPYGVSGSPVSYSLQGSTIVATPLRAGTYPIIYDAKLVPLTSSNASNWLLVADSNVYLFGCLAAAEAYNKNLGEVAFWAGQATEALDELVIQSDVAQYGNAGITIDMVLP